MHKFYRCHHLDLYHFILEKFCGIIYAAIAAVVGMLCFIFSQWRSTWMTIPNWLSMVFNSTTSNWRTMRKTESCLSCWTFWNSIRYYKNICIKVAKLALKNLHVLYSICSDFIYCNVCYRSLSLWSRCSDVWLWHSC